MLKQEFSDGLQISMNIKDITIPLIIHYYLLRAFRTLHKSFHAIITSGFFMSAPKAYAIRMLKPCVHRFNLFPDTPAGALRQAVDIVNPGIQ